MDATEDIDDPINIDTSQIPSQPLENTFTGSTLENLTKLGVQSYNPDAIEEGILSQVSVLFFGGKCEHCSD